MVVGHIPMVDMWTSHINMSLELSVSALGLEQQTSDRQAEMVTIQPRGGGGGGVGWGVD